MILLSTYFVDEFTIILTYQRFVINTNIHQQMFLYIPHMQCFITCSLMMIQSEKYNIWLK